MIIGKSTVNKVGLQCFFLGVSLWEIIILPESITADNDTPTV